MKNGHTLVELYYVQLRTTIKVLIRTMLKVDIKTATVIINMLRIRLSLYRYVRTGAKQGDIFDGVIGSLGPCPTGIRTLSGSRILPGRNRSAGFVLRRCLENLTKQFSALFRTRHYYSYPSAAASIMNYPLRGEADLRQSLVVAGDGAGGEQQQQQVESTTTPPALAFLTLEIKAPSALPGGYQLRVQHGGTKLVVPVPAGGVEANQVFRVVVPNPAVAANKNKRPLEESSAPSFGGTTAGTTTTTGPVGHWKDGFLDIFKYGVFHPHAVTSLACSLCKCAGGRSTTSLSLCFLEHESLTLLKYVHCFFHDPSVIGGHSTPLHHQSFHPSIHSGGRPGHTKAQVYLAGHTRGQ
jgi:hypothetical protein